MVSGRLILLVSLASAALGVPSPADLKSDLTILVDNDLLGPESNTADSGILFLGEKKNLKDAESACEALGEQLWSPELGTASIQRNLDYLRYQQKNQKCSAGSFWIAPKGKKPRTLSASGKVSEGKKGSKLPVICTQTAPFSDNSAQDTSEKWQVSVRSNNENLVGYRDRTSFRFMGVRYAPEPERFTHTKPYKGKGGTVSALKYGAQCFQGNSGSEDCHFLNIWTPYLPRPGPTKRKDLKPVMFWVHGGAFTGGTANDATFDGGNIVSRGDVVLVAINYRLGKFGFLALDDGKTKGNYGFADTIQALDWVREHIADFGGDKDRITVFGQSAGAAVVRAMMASPKAKGKFAAAIPLSNLGGLAYGTTYSKYLTIDEAVERGSAAVLGATNCTDARSQVECLREVPAEELAAAGGDVRFLVVDGKYLTSDELPLSGKRWDFHLMMGITAEDGAPMISFPRDVSPTDEEWLTSQGLPYPPRDLYPLPALENTTMATQWMGARLATDAVFRCVDQATVHAALQNRLLREVYYYEFDRSYQTPGWPRTDLCEPQGRPDGDPSAEPGYLKCHSGELLYVFGNIAREGLPFRDADDVKFARLSLDMFASFARTYDPNPERGFLEARGFEDTLEAVERSGRWEPAVRGDLKLRSLTWPEVKGRSMEGFRDTEQCEWLDLGLDYYL